MSTNKQNNQQWDDSQLGDIDISAQVISGIAVETAKQIPGVYAVKRPNNNLQSLFTKEESVFLYENDTDHISLDMAVVLDYGVSVPNVCFKLQEAITEQVANMTDIELAEVNISVINLNINKELVK